MEDFSQKDERWMSEALEEARQAELAGEVPVGCVIVANERIVARAGNRTIQDNDPTAHAEMVALRKAARELGNYRMTGATLYVTIEPCAMCAGAMIQARVTRLVYGADDPKAGAVRSSFGILDEQRLNHRIAVKSGVLAGDCAGVLQAFFAARR